MDSETRQKAEEAAFILQSEVFYAVFKHLDAVFISQWRASKCPDERERLHISQDVLGDIKREIIKNIQKAANAERSNDSLFTNILKQLKLKFKE